MELYDLGKSYDTPSPEKPSLKLVESCHNFDVRTFCIYLRDQALARFLIVALGRDINMNALEKEAKIQKEGQSSALWNGKYKMKQRCMYI